MPMRAEQRMIREQEEFAAKRAAQLDVMYNDEINRIYTERIAEGCSSSNVDKAVNPIIHISTQASSNCNFNITLSDSQFEAFKEMVRDTLMLLS